jgi:DNA-binding response OmpR family regulator
VLAEDDLLDVRQRQPRVDGNRIDLTRLEFELLNHLIQQAGSSPYA